MIHRRGVLPVLLLLALVLFGLGAQIVRGPAAAAPRGQLDARPSSTPESGAPSAVLRSLVAVERSYDAGDVRRLCRPGVLVDPAVIRAEDAQPRGCEAPLEDLMANVPRLRLTVLEVTLRPDLATATVAAANGSRAAVDFVRRGRRWLLSFSDGAAPMPALAGTT